MGDFYNVILFVAYFIPLVLCGLVFDKIAVNKEPSTFSSFKTLMVDNVFRCLGICLHEHQCVLFDHDELKGLSAITCRFYSEHSYSQTMQETEGITVHGILYAKDCVDWYEAGRRKNGVYSIMIGDEVVRVYCNMEIHGGGWIVFQKRFNGTLLFNKDWKTYKRGFGNVEGEYWLGNEYLHQITSSGTHDLLVVAKSFDGVEKIAGNGGFRLDSESNFYKLHCEKNETSFFTSRLHIGQSFSTPDQDNDIRDNFHCADTFNSGWWFSNCLSNNLNGVYTRNEVKWNHGVMWNRFKEKESMMETVMMTRRQL